MKLSQIRRLKALTSFYASDIYEAMQPPCTSETWDNIINNASRNYLLLAEISHVLTRFHGDADNPFEMCTDCARWEPQSEGIEDTDGLYKCSSCVEHYYFRSDHSGEWFHRDYGVRVYHHTDEQYWSQYEADNYAWQCDDCGEYFSDRSDRHATDQDGHVCNECRDDSWYYCDCGNLTQSGNSDGETDICNDCIDDYHWCAEHSCYHRHDSDWSECHGDEDDDDDGRYIRSYSSKVEVHVEWGTPINNGKYLKKKVANLYMGIELEVEVPRDSDDSRGGLACDLLEATKDKIFCCEDGSLTNGFEIKTAPNNLAETKAIFEAILATSAAKRLRSHDGGNCGLHINLSRAGLSQLQQAKILTFYNAAQNEKFLKALCRRYSPLSQVNNRTNYARVDPAVKLAQVVQSWSRDYAELDKPHTAFCGCTRKGKVLSKRGSVMDYRYAAVNFTPEKVEIRLPRGTLKRNTLLANLELARALTEFTRTGEENAGSGRYVTEFAEWMRLRPRSAKEFPELTLFMRERGFLTAPIKDTYLEDWQAYTPNTETNLQFFAA
jgi:hypothetical protein